MVQLQFRNTKRLYDASNGFLAVIVGSTVLRLQIDRAFGVSSGDVADVRFPLCDCNNTLVGGSHDYFFGYFHNITSRSKIVRRFQCETRRPGYNNWLLSTIARAQVIGVDETVVWAKPGTNC